MIGANNDNDGYANTLVWINAYNNGVVNNSDAPYLAYFYDPNNTERHDNWYLPARNELTALFNSIDFSDINTSLQNNEGQQILTEKYYWSSTEIDGDHAYRIKRQDNQASVDDKDKDKSEYVRAFKEIGG